MSFAKWMSLFGLLLTLSTWQYVNTLMATTYVGSSAEKVLQAKNINALNKNELK
ncbi:MAG: hypothetical protein Q9O24_09350 [Gammaproteobacteria bacterium]|nr:hypothetical protein [Gammaproteobacteria bacterium]MDQ7075338.1 hypothetical protein [Gammaproteobacteria bacterium]